MPREIKPTPTLAATLANHRIWGLLGAADLERLVPLFHCEDAPNASTLLTQGQLHTRLGLILQGDVSLMDPDLGLKIRLHAGEMFGFGATPQHQLTTWQAKSATACRIAWLKPDTIVEVCRQHRELGYFFTSLPDNKTRTDLGTPSDDTLNLLSTPIRSMIKRARSPAPPPPFRPWQL
jgi:CBS domain-containing protein